MLALTPLRPYNPALFIPLPALLNGRDFAISELAMKADIHPKYDEVTITCSCGNSFQTRSTVGKDLTIEVCSQCHPFYTGQQKIVDTAGRVDKFRRRYARS